MSKRTITVQARAAEAKPATKPGSRKRQSVEKSAPVQKTMRLTFVPAEGDKHVTQTKFRYAETGDKQAVGAFYLSQEQARNLGIAEGDSIVVTVERKQSR